MSSSVSKRDLQDAGEAFSYLQAVTAKHFPATKVTQANWDSYQKQYQIFDQKVVELYTSYVEKIRKRGLALTSMRNIFTAFRKPITDLHFVSPLFRFHIKNLKKRYPDCQEHLKIFDCQGAYMGKTRYKFRDEYWDLVDDEVYDSVMSFPWSHPALKVLRLSTDEYRRILSNDARAQAARHSNTLKVNIQEILGFIRMVYDAPDPSNEEMGVALFMACGRRPIEMIYKGVYKKSRKPNYLRFSGQAKVHEIKQRPSYLVPLVGLDSGEFIDLVNRYRQGMLDRHEDCQSFKDIYDRFRTTYSANCNNFIRSNFDSWFKYYDLRTVYGCVAFHLYQNDYPNDSILSFVRQVLGQTSISVAQRYTAVRVVTAKSKSLPGKNPDLSKALTLVSGSGNPLVRRLLEENAKYSNLQDWESYEPYLRRHRERLRRLQAKILKEIEPGTEQTFYEDLYQHLTVDLTFKLRLLPKILETWQLEPHLVQRLQSDRHPEVYEGLSQVMAKGYKLSKKMYSFEHQSIKFFRKALAIVEDRDLFAKPREVDAEGIYKAIAGIYRKDERSFEESAILIASLSGLRLSDFVKGSIKGGARGWIRMRVGEYEIRTFIFTRLKVLKEIQKEMLNAIPPGEDPVYFANTQVRTEKISKIIGMENTGIRLLQNLHKKILFDVFDIAKGATDSQVRGEKIVFSKPLDSKFMDPFC